MMSRRLMSKLVRTVDDRRRTRMVSQLVSRPDSSSGRLRLQVAASLHWSGVMLSGATLDGIAPVRVNLILPELREAAMFAGIDTALRVAGALAISTRLPLRVISIGNDLAPGSYAALLAEVRRRSGVGGDLDLELVGRSALADLAVNKGDIWVTTHWTTANAVDRAIELARVIDRSRVFYLIQDYEPGFMPWSTEFAVARGTYHAGFHRIINSIPLAQYLESVEGLAIDYDCVFRPEVELPAEMPSLKAKSQRLQVFFYGRPSKPRNLFGLGVAVLQEVAREVEDRGYKVDFVSAGEFHPTIRLTVDGALRSLGRLSWADYFRTIARSDVVLSLQHSPHPSHPPLDAVVRGCYVVTNEFGGVRESLSPLIAAREPRAGALAEAIVNALDRAMAEGRPAPDTGIVAKLGVPLRDAVSSALERLGEPLRGVDE